MSDDICYLSATQAVALFKAKKLSPVELMKAVIERAERTNGKLKAFTFTFFDEALDLAKKAEVRYAKRVRTGALEGLPIGIKDENWIEGKPTSFGSIIDKDYIADRTSPNNARIIKAGGIVHARTTTPEYSITPYTNSRLWGVTRNPWNSKFTPGGSSGGSSASLAAGSSTLATASDIGGSIRIPASTCGLVGYMPPYGRNPDDAPFNLDPYVHTGPLARTVSDAILLQNVISGPHPDDAGTIRPKLLLPESYKPIKGLKIAFSMNLGYFTVDKEVQKNTLAALDVFRMLGASVEEVDLGWTADCYKAANLHLAHIFGGQMAAKLKKHRKVMSPYAIDFANLGKKGSREDYLWAMDIACSMYKSFGALMENFDVLICPTTAIPAVKADFDHSRDTIRINGKEPPLQPPMLNWVLTTPFNTISRAPVLAVPSGFASNGVPTGIQIVGRTYCDKDVFRFGMAYEEAVGGWFNAPGKRPKN